MEERQAQAAAARDSSGAAVPSVDRFTADQIASLPTVVYSRASASYSECSVCLSDFVDGERLTKLPCAAGHLLRMSCASECLSRSVFCPLCRVDLSTIIVPKAEDAANSVAADAPAALEPPLSPRQLGFTRDGGVSTPRTKLAPRPTYYTRHRLLASILAFECTLLPSRSPAVRAESAGRYTAPQLHPGGEPLSGELRRDPVPRAWRCTDLAGAEVIVHRSSRHHGAVAEPDTRKKAA